MGVYCTILLFFHLFYRFEVFLNKKLGGSNYNVTAILLEKNLSPMAVLEIVTNCSLRKRNPISCHGGSVVVTCVTCGSKKALSCRGTRINEQCEEWVQGNTRWQVPNKGVGMIFLPNIKITWELRGKDVQGSEHERKVSGRLLTPHYGVTEARVSHKSACPLVPDPQLKF